MEEIGGQALGQTTRPTISAPLKEPNSINWKELLRTTIEKGHILNKTNNGRGGGGIKEKKCDSIEEPREAEQLFKTKSDVLCGGGVGRGGDTR